MEARSSDTAEPGELADKRLDFFSKDFDAASALSVEGLQPPNPKVRPLDYLAKCRALLPPEIPDSRAARMAEKPKLKRDEVSRRKYEESRSRVARQRALESEQEAEGTALQRIADAVPEGPLNVLRRAMQGRQLLRVVTRHGRGVRGVATGELVAFDAHMNLIMRDVMEHYTVRLRTERSKVVSRLTAGGHVSEDDSASESGSKKRGKVERSRLAWKQEHRTRQLQQALLRGSCIILVSMAPAAPTPPGPPPVSATAATIGYPPPGPSALGCVSPAAAGAAGAHVPGPPPLGSGGLRSSEGHVGLEPRRAPGAAPGSAAGAPPPPPPPEPPPELSPVHLPEQLSQAPEWHRHRR